MHIKYHGIFAQKTTNIEERLRPKGDLKHSISISGTKLLTSISVELNFVRTKQPNIVYYIQRLIDCINLCKHGS